MKWLSLFFFFSSRRRHTRCSRDWSSDVCSSDLGHGNTVEVGGTQIERAGRIRIAVRIRDIIVRDRDHVVVATAPKAEVKLSGSAAMPAPAAPPSAGAAQSGTAPAVAGNRDTTSGLLAGLDWLDSLSLTGLDGQNLNEIGLKNGNLIVDDQQRGNKWNFENISLSLRRPRAGGVALSVGEEGRHAWSLRVLVGPPENGVRSVDIRADKVSTSNILLALRLKDLTYSADLPLTGELKGELS